MLRVLKPGGLILWYDFHVDNPHNRDVQGVRKREIFELFSGCDIRLHRITLAPPIVRLVAPIPGLPAICSIRSHGCVPTTLASCAKQKLRHTEHK